MIPKISIVSPVFNLISSGREELFRRCANSIWAHKKNDFLEHIVVDGLSDDGTVEYLENLSREYGFKLVFKKDSSIYEGMNNGLRLANGQYVLFVNSDDFLSSGDALQRAVNCIESAEADYLYGDVNVVGKDGAIMDVWRGNLSELPFARHYCHQSMIVRTDLLQSLGGFDLRYRISADSDLMLRLFHDGFRAVHCSDVFANYQYGGMSVANWRIAQSDHAAAFCKYFGNECGLDLDDCRFLWCYDGIGKLSYEDCERLLVALPKMEWRQAWLRQMRLRYVGTWRVINKNGLTHRIKEKFKKNGCFGVCAACLRRVVGG